MLNIKFSIKLVVFKRGGGPQPLEILQGASENWRKDKRKKKNICPEPYNA